jgi:hypothetical protein
MVNKNHLAASTAHWELTAEELADGLQELLAGGWLVDVSDIEDRISITLPGRAWVGRRHRSRAVPGKGPQRGRGATQSDSEGEDTGGVSSTSQKGEVR